MTKINESDNEILYNLEASFRKLEEVDKPTLIEFIRAQRRKIDELENIKRNDDGEQIIEEDKAIEDEEEVIK